MAARIPAKSILKQPSQGDKQFKLSDEQKSKAEIDRNNLKIALHHAYRIQDQKDVEAQILQSIEILIDYPSGSNFTPDEARDFAQRVRQFQPSDLDDLAEERRIDGRCGYVLCRNAPRQRSKGSEVSWSLSKGAADYCSNDCVRKAVFIKTQLSETPAWERPPGFQPEVRLHQDELSVDEEAKAQLERARQRKLLAEEAVLAEERGERPTSFRPKQVMMDNVVEKKSVQYQPLSSLHGATVSHTAIEGYEPQGAGTKKRPNRDESDDSDDDD